MDQTTNIESLKRLIQEFCSERDWDQFHAPKELAIGLSTEANEVLELFRFKNEAEVLEKLQNSEFRTKLSNELADVLFFLLRFSQLYNFDLSDGLRSKMTLNAQKYPAEKVKGSNKKYNEYP
ncbi:MAG: nucleotide pyrophosphohydrolase [Pseudobdellovibrio sp.]